MHVLVTGGAGFIGSHVVDALVARGDSVTVIDDLSSGEERFVNPAAEFVKLDVRDPAAADLVRSRRFSGICHLAAQMSVSRSMREPIHDADVNVLGSLRLIEAASETGSRFVFSGTGGAVYGEAEVLPTPESSPAWPISPYGISKLATEHYLYGYSRHTNLSYAALRYANVYGPRQNPHGEAGVVAIFCRRLLAGEACVINGSGEDTRDYVHVSDVVRANLAALDSRELGHFNVGTGRQTSVNLLFDIVAELLAPGAHATHGPARAGDLARSCLDSSLIGKRLGWAPAMRLEDGLDQTAQWFRGDSPPSD